MSNSDFDRINERRHTASIKWDSYTGNGDVIPLWVADMDFRTAPVVREAMIRRAESGTGREIVIRVAGRGFLYNMVRIIAGTLMEVGRGKLPPECVKDILAACDRQAAGPTAPACGLTLIGYEFL